MNHFVYVLLWEGGVEVSDSQAALVKWAHLNGVEKYFISSRKELIV